MINCVKCITCLHFVGVVLQVSRWKIQNFGCTENKSETLSFTTKFTSVFLHNSCQCLYKSQKFTSFQWNNLCPNFDKHFYKNYFHKYTAQKKNSRCQCLSTLSPSKHTGNWYDQNKVYLSVLPCHCCWQWPWSGKPIFAQIYCFWIDFLSNIYITLYWNSGINRQIPSIAQFMDLAFSCLVWSCEASRKAQTSIESLPEIWVPKTVLKLKILLLFSVLLNHVMKLKVSVLFSYAEIFGDRPKTTHSHSARYGPKLSLICDTVDLLWSFSPKCSYTVVGGTLVVMGNVNIISHMLWIRL